MFLACLLSAAGFPWTSNAVDILSGGVGKSCGECFELFGDAGSITVMYVQIDNNNLKGVYVTSIFIVKKVFAFLRGKIMRRVV